MKVKGVVRVTKKEATGIWVQIEVSGIVGNFKGFVPLDNPVDFETESPFEIEMKVKEEPKKVVAASEKPKATKPKGKK